MFITNQADLEAFIERAQSSSVLAIDTEFLREKTYYAKLCLVQLGTDDEVVIVDPFAVEDLTVLADLLVNPNIMKLFHAGTQDLEILLRDVGVLPSPIFDTQVAAALMGHTQQIGYASLVHAMCGVTLKKADSYTDWSRRPLSDSQIKYAADDVVYLPRMYEKMRRELEQKGRLAWLEPDFAEMINPRKYDLNERMRWSRLKRASHMSRRQLAAAREVAAWRELTACKRNVPRKWILTDEQIVEACRREPRSVDDLFMVRGIRDRLSTKDARYLVRLIGQGLDSPSDTWPSFETPGRNEPNVDAQVDLMEAIVRLRAKENGVAMPTLASRDDLSSLARGHKDVDVMRGWRLQLVGNDLMELLEGKISLSLKKGELVITRL